MTATGALVWLALDTPWVWPAMFVFGVVMSVPSYALSHETAHGTAFRTRWLNEGGLLGHLPALRRGTPAPALYPHQPPHAHLVCRPGQPDAFRHPAST